MGITIAFLIYAFFCFKAGDMEGGLLVVLPFMIGIAVGAIVFISETKHKKKGAECMRKWEEYKRKKGQL